MMKKIEIDNVQYSLPSAWSEVGTAQLRQLASICTAFNVYSELKVRITFALLGLHVAIAKPYASDSGFTYAVRNRRGRIHRLTAEQVVAIARCVDWMFTRQHDESLHFAPYITRNPLPSIRRWGRTYSGPADALTSITFYQFIYAETYMYRYSSTGADRWLHKFVATLWRRTKFDGEPTPAECRTASKLTAEEVTMVLWFYAASKKFMGRKFKLVFAGVGDGKKADPYQNYLDLTATLAGSDVTKMEQVRQSNLYEALTALQQMLQQDKKNSEHINKMRNVRPH